MNKSSRRWKVFVIVLCMLFTMMPGTVFADDSAANQPAAEQPLNNDGDQLNPGTPPEGGNLPDAVSPTVLPDPDTLPGSGEPPTDGTTEGGIEKPEVIPSSEENAELMKAVYCPEYGTLKITKKVNDKPESIEDTTFTFNVEKKSWNWVTWKWDYEKIENSPFTIVGAGVKEISVETGTYRITEQDVDNYSVDDADHEKEIKKNKTTNVTFTNTYTGPIPGSIKITKKITGDTPTAPATFSFMLTGPDNYSQAFTITGTGSKTIGDLKIGEYTITETNVPDNYQAVSNGSKITISKNHLDRTFNFENKYTKPTTLTIKKEVIGNPGSPAEFKFAVEKHQYKHYWPYEEYVPVTTVTILGEGEQQVNVDSGYYRITEINIPGNYNVIGSNPKFAWVINKCNTDVTFKNKFTGPATGGITIIKDIQGDMPPVPGDQFTFTITDGFGYSETISITGEASATIRNLTPGAVYTITEAAIANYTPRTINPVVVNPGEPTEVTVINDYNDPNIKEPAAYVSKKVAVYNGTIPPDSSFVSQLDLYELNKEVIYKIDLWCNLEWRKAEKLAYLQDIYNGTGITDSLQIFDGSAFKLAKDEVSMYPYMYLNYEYLDTFFYKVTLPANGTYTNTAYLYEAEPQYSASVGDGEGIEKGAIASSSAIVTVKYTPGGNGDNGGGGGGGGSTKYYEVTYNANWPAGADLSGSVPTDSKVYTYNTIVSVKGNTDGLKAGTYTFEGWNTKADGTGTMYLPGNTFNIKEDTILYAQWKLTGEPAAAVPETDSSAAVSAETAGLDDVPKTGDTAPLIPMLLLGLLSLAAITLSRKKISD